MTLLRWWALAAVTGGAVLALAIRAARTGRGPLRTAGSTAVGLLVVTAAVLGVGCGYAAHLQQQGDLHCPVEPGGSTGTYGEFAWSRWPPGPTCSFTAEVHGRDEVRGPTPVMSVWLVTVSLGAAGSAVLLRRDAQAPAGSDRLGSDSVER